MNVLLLTIDALRWDVAQNMRWFGKWAREKAVWFKNHYAVAHCSDPNYLSLLSGLHPDSHGVVTQITQEDDKAGNPWPGYPKFANIPSWLKKFHGHRCGAYTATYPQFYWYGLDEVTPMGRLVKTKVGWKQVKAFMANKDNLANSQTWVLPAADGAGDQVLEPGGVGTLSWAPTIPTVSSAHKTSSEPWYFFVRTMDCHAPYRAGGYQQAVRVTDNLIKDLITHVEREYPDTLVVVCSDHGEALGEHGMNGHWSTLYQVLVRTPMYLSWPGCPAGVAVEELTQHQDLFATVVDLFGGYEPRIGAGFDGWPMTWAMRGVKTNDQLSFVGHGVFHEAYQQHRALLRWPWKYIVSAHIKEGPRFELYDLAEDPWEKNDLAAAMPDKLREMADALAGNSPAAKDFVQPDTADQWDIGIDEAEAEVIMGRLEALGYAG